MSDDRKTVQGPQQGVNYRTDVDGVPPEDCGRLHEWRGQDWCSCSRNHICVPARSTWWRLQPPAPVSEPEPEEDDGWCAFEEEAPEVGQLIRLKGTSKRYWYWGRVAVLRGFGGYRIQAEDLSQQAAMPGTVRWRPCAPLVNLRELAQHHSKRCGELEAKWDRDAQPEPGEPRYVVETSSMGHLNVLKDRHTDTVMIGQHLREPLDRLASLLNAGERARLAAGVGTVEEVAGSVTDVRNRRGELVNERDRLRARAEKAEARVAELEAEVERLRDLWSVECAQHSTTRDELRLANQMGRREADRADRCEEESGGIIEELQAEIASLRSRSLPEGVPWPDEMSWGHRHQIRLAVSGNWVLRNYDDPAEVGTLDACLARLKEELGDAS